MISIPPQVSFEMQIVTQLSGDATTAFCQVTSVSPLVQMISHAAFRQVTHLPTVVK
jgi:hypothetical protein